MPNFVVRLMIMLALLLPFCNVFAADKDVEAKIGAKAIAIPVPKDFSDPSLMFPKLRQLGEAMTPPSNRLLAFFISDDDAKAMLAQAEPQLHRYFLVQTLRAKEDSTMSAQVFAGVRDQLKNQYKKILDDNAARMQSEMNKAVERLDQNGQVKNISMKLGELQVREVIDDERFVALIAKTLVQVMVSGEAKEIPMVLGLTTTMIEGKIVYFFSYSRFDSDEDMNWIKTKNLEWLTLFFYANKAK
ncbi:hypothetical protein [Undibacterium sp. Di24W]|uniref:hypothetical protein n=1 Tax=Undibacterium sp. Di24W TaxID=3413033 RepID=UPI003BEF8F6C